MIVIIVLIVIIAKALSIDYRLDGLYVFENKAKK